MPNGTTHQQALDLLRELIDRGVQLERDMGNLDSLLRTQKLHLEVAQFGHHAPNKACRKGEVNKSVQ